MSTVYYMSGTSNHASKEAAKIYADKYMRNCKAYVIRGDVYSGSITWLSTKPMYKEQVRFIIREDDNLVLN